MQTKGLRLSVEKRKKDAEKTEKNGKLWFKARRREVQGTFRGQCVLRGAPVSTTSTVGYALRLVCVLLFHHASSFAAQQSCMFLSSKHVSTNAHVSSYQLQCNVTWVYLYVICVCPCMIDALYTRQMLLLERQSKPVLSAVIEFVQSQKDSLRYWFLYFAPVI